MQIMVATEMQQMNVILTHMDNTLFLCIALHANTGFFTTSGEVVHY